MFKKLETFDSTLDGKRALHDDRKAAFVRDLLQPLVCEATRGRVFSMTYRGGDSSEWVRLYLSDGDSASDVEVSGMDELSMALAVISEIPRPREAGETAKARVDWRRSPEFADHLEDMVRAMAQKMSDKDGHCHVSLRQLMFVARHIREASD